MIQTGSRVAQFDDPDYFAAHVQNSHIRLLPEQRGPFRARLTLVRLANVHMSMGEENLPRLFRAELSPDRLFFSLQHLDERPIIRNGITEVPGTVRVATEGFPVHDRTASAAVWRSLSFRPEDLAAHAERLAHPRAVLNLGHGELFRPAPEAFARLAALQRDTFRLAQQQPAALAHQASAWALDTQICEALVAALASSDTEAEAESAARQRGHAIMLRTEAFIEAHPSQPLSLGELCAVGGCSAKTLEMLFRDRLGMTPNRYLRRRRLALARRALLAADPRSNTVSGIALGCGFWELGRFAVAYRQVFGESPSDTLRRTGVATLKWGLRHPTTNPNDFCIAAGSPSA